MLAGGVLVQRFGDLVKGSAHQRTPQSKSTTRPTLTAAVPGDLSLALPKRQLDDIIEMIYALDKLAPGTANYDTLLYGAEVKFILHAGAVRRTGDQAARPVCHRRRRGVTRGWHRAALRGSRRARAIVKRLGKGG
jgi:uncharacterized FAD-dependent dehydrogenase